MQNEFDFIEEFLSNENGKKWWKPQ